MDASLIRESWHSHVSIYDPFDRSQMHRSAYVQSSFAHYQRYIPIIHACKYTRLFHGVSHRFPGRLALACCVLQVADRAFSLRTVMCTPTRGLGLTGFNWRYTDTRPSSVATMRCQSTARRIHINTALNRLPSILMFYLQVICTQRLWSTSERLYT
jgi:hypothetical protein